MAFEPESSTPAIKTSPLAIWSLVLGVLGLVLLVVCIGPLFAIPGVICGHLAYLRIKRSGGVLTGEGMALAGLITGYISIALAVVWIPLMAAIAIPNFVRARQVALTHVCINKLREIDAAKQTWALQYNKDTNATPTAADLTQFLRRDFGPFHCPAGGTYAINKVGEPPTCSIPNHRLRTGADQQSDSGDGEGQDGAVKKLAAAKTQNERFYALNAAAKESFNGGKVEDARKYAQELMDLLPQFQGDWNYGNAVQDANLVLGRIALREGNVEEAKRRLIEAGKSPGSPQMNSFGPNMSLAEDLLKKGERQVVLDYFALCRKFWKMDYGKLALWSKEVKAGRIPDFGANLVY